MKPQQVPTPGKPDPWRVQRGKDRQTTFQVTIKASGPNRMIRWRGKSGQRCQGNPLPAEPDQGAVVEGEGYLDQDGPGFEQDNFGPFGLVQIIPIVIFLALLVVLVLTFITYTIPEFPGAVGSSILIVTLIIYGAATLLKA